MVLRLPGAIARFSVGQTSVQLVNVLTGFLLLRWLSVDGYAQYSLAAALQATLSQLLDLGLGGAVVALVGRDRGDRGLIGRYIGAARTLRRWLLWALIPPGGVALLVLASRQGWPVFTQVLLGIGVLAAIAFQGDCAYYAAPLLLHQSLARYYRPQLLVAMLRLILSGSLFILGGLTGWSATWVVAAGTFCHAALLRRASTEFVRESSQTDRAALGALLRYIGPIAPGVAFSALLSQLSVFLATTFGGTQTIAETGALGRLGQVFLLLSALNTVVLGPRVAQLPAAELPRAYLQIMGLAGGVCCVLTLGTAILPGSWLALLGPSYRHLRAEVVPAVAAACLTYLGNAAWSIHAMRKWVFWWSTWFYIVLVVIVQLAGALLFDLGTTLGVVRLSLLTGAAVLLVHAVTAIAGFRRERPLRTPKLD